MFYSSGDCLVLNIPTSDSDDIPEIVRRLEEISIGCQVKLMKIGLDEFPWVIKLVLCNKTSIIVLKLWLVQEMT